MTTSVSSQLTNGQHRHTSNTVEKAKLKLTQSFLSRQTTKHVKNPYFSIELMLRHAVA